MDTQAQTQHTLGQTQKETAAHLRLKEDGLNQTTMDAKKKKPTGKSAGSLDLGGKTCWSFNLQKEVVSNTMVDSDNDDYESDKEGTVSFSIFTFGCFVLHYSALQ